MPMCSKIIVLLLMICGTGIAADNQLTKEEQESGWLLLFDGETQFGWKSTGKAIWDVQDGVISASEGEACLLRTTTQFCDYVFKVDFRAGKTTNRSPVD